METCQKFVIAIKKFKKNTSENVSFLELTRNVMKQPRAHRIEYKGCYPIRDPDSEEAVKRVVHQVFGPPSPPSFHGGDDDKQQPQSSSKNIGSVLKWKRKRSEVEVESIPVSLQIPPHSPAVGVIR